MKKPNRSYSPGTVAKMRATDNPSPLDFDKLIEAKDSLKTTAPSPIRQKGIKQVDGLNAEAIEELKRRRKRADEARDRAKVTKRVFD